jgi:hypothetical protein
VIIVSSDKKTLTNEEVELKKKLNFGGCIAKVETLGIELKISSNFGGCIVKIETLGVELKIDSNFGE